MMINRSLYCHGVGTACGLLLTGVVCALSTVSCAESNFEIARDSRLPRWFAIPAGLSRADVTATMQFYVPKSEGSVRFKLWDASGHKLAQVSGTGSDVVTFGPRTPAGGFDERSYSLYEIITANGITEVIEHRRFLDRVFYVSDDPEVKRRLDVK